MQLKRKIGSLKSTFNVVIVIKIFFIKNIKHRNSLSTVLKQSKRSYNNYFRNNINNIKITCKGINKSIVSLNTKESESPKTICNNKGEFLTNPDDIVNQFNNFFCSIAPTIQSNIKPNFKSFDNYLTEPCKESFLISSCTKNEVLEIISSLDYNKAIGINSIPIKILKMTKEKIAKHLCFIYNLSFTTGIFPDSVKITKVTTVYKKCSKLECANYRPTSLLSNLDEIIEKRMHKRLIGFLNDQKVPYKKQFGFQKKFSTVRVQIIKVKYICKNLA